ncbi:MAG: ABC transporter ATP-binding protein [Jatrophihabitantaceae bacterium]
MTSPAPLELVDVSKTLAGTSVLHAVSFECPAGEITALLGPNGAGKTTSVALATGLRSASAGQVRVFGHAVSERAARYRLSLVPQEIGLPASVTVRRCLNFVGGQRPPSPLATSRAEICERLGISGLLERRAGGLSGGQQRKVAVALGLLRAPGLLIMDEATTSLDERTRATTWQLVREYADRGGAALVTSHILADIDAHADRVVALNDGRVVLASPLALVRARLGGSVVAISLPPTRRAEVLEQVRIRQLDARPVAPAAPGSTASDVPGSAGRVRLEWRTPAPVPFVAVLSQLAPDAVDLVVRPIPLGDLLAELAGP